jgi:Rnl2 family RNA ligase
MNFPRYPEIALLPRCPEILSVKEVIATEKLHGSNFRVFFPAGMSSIEDVQYGSREVENDPTGAGPKFPLPNAIQWFKTRPQLLTQIWETIKTYGYSDVTVFGEAFGPGVKAKGVKYSDGQEMLFRAFDIMIGKNFLTYDLFCEVTDKMGLERVPLIWRGEPSKEAFDALLERPSDVAKANGIESIAEGVVIRSNPLLRDVFGSWLIIKHKSKAFSEVTHAPTAPKSKEATPADIFAATYVTAGRVTNAIGRLQDRGVVLKNDMTDMPVLLTEMVADLHKECEPEMVALGVPAKQLQGAVSKVLAPLYRATLG